MNPPANPLAPEPFARTFHLGQSVRGTLQRLAALSTSQLTSELVEVNWSKLKLVGARWGNLSALCFAIRRGSQRLRTRLIPKIDKLLKCFQVASDDALSELYLSLCEIWKTADLPADVHISRSASDESRYRAFWLFALFVLCLVSLWLLSLQLFSPACLSAAGKAPDLRCTVSVAFFWRSPSCSAVFAFLFSFSYALLFTFPYALPFALSHSLPLSNSHFRCFFYFSSNNARR